MTKNKITFIRLLIFCIFSLLISVFLTLTYFFNQDSQSKTLISYQKYTPKYVNNKLKRFVFITSTINFYRITYIIKKALPPPYPYLFRIKEKNQPNWYYQSVAGYISEKDGYFYDLTFPVINDSRNKTYIIEFEINDKNPNHRFTITKEDKFILSFQQPQYFKIKNKLLFFDFILQKKISYLAYPGFISILILFFSFPFFTWIFFKNIDKIINRFSFSLSSRDYFILFLIIYSIFIPKETSEKITFLFAMLWLINSIISLKSGEFSLFFSFLGLIITSGLHFFHLVSLTEKTAIWSYLFLTCGIISILLNPNTVHKFVKKNRVILKIVDLLYLIKNQLLKSRIVNLVKRNNLYIRIVKLFKKCVTFFINWIRYQYQSLFQYKEKVKIYLIFLYWLVTHKKWTELCKEFFRILMRLIVAGIIIVAIAILYFSCIFYIQKEKNRLHRLSLNPVIQTIEPSLIYKASKVVIYGNNFGTTQAPLTKVMRNNYPISVDLWTDNKIVFTVPLDWKEGKQQIWVEKPIFWEDKTIISSSDVFTITLLPITENFTAEDDVYFQLVPSLKKETREINGYQ